MRPVEVGIRIHHLRLIQIPNFIPRSSTLLRESPYPFREDPFAATQSPRPARSFLLEPNHPSSITRKALRRILLPFAAIFRSFFLTEVKMVAFQLLIRIGLTLSRHTLPGKP